MNLRVFGNNTELEDQHLNSIDGQTLNETREILTGIRRFGAQAIILHASRVGDITSEDTSSCCVTRQQLHDVFKEISVEERKFLVSIVKSVYNHYTSKYNITVNLPTTKTLGCFIPLRSQSHLQSVILKILSAKILCVETVIVTSRKPSKILLAAAYIAGADYFLLFGGVHAIGALSFGFKTSTFELPPCNKILGLGNHWVESAKKIISEEYVSSTIDFIGGANQILIILDATQTATMSSIIDTVVGAIERKERMKLYVFSEDSSIVTEFKNIFEKHVEDSIDTTLQNALKVVIGNSYGKLFSSYDNLIETVLKFCPERYFIFAEDSYKSKIRESLATNSYLGGYMNRG